VVFGANGGAGAFYRLMPHNAMAVLFGAVFLYAIVALAMGVRAFWRDIASRPARCSSRARYGRRCGTPAGCAISTAAASAA